MSARLRPRLSRTFTAARWDEYRRTLEAARDAGYRIAALEDWVFGGHTDGRVLVVRHDVDQHPRSALTMAAIENELGVHSTWYLRWRTADRGVVRELRERGGSVGLHYETLSRLALARAISDAAQAESLVQEACALLRDEIRAFVEIHGPISSICAHGDTRIPAVRNSSLMEDRDPRAFGVEFDANAAMRGRGLAHWLTDRSAADGRWADRVRPEDLFSKGVSPILAVVHPNNWVSGPSLWIDRMLGSALPAGDGGARGRSRPLRTGSDAPPL
jgi:hypothetical protein